MKEKINELDIIALLHDHPEKGLVAGNVGTVVEILATGVYEVEFSDDEGCTYAMAVLKEKEVMILHYSQVAA